MPFMISIYLLPDYLKVCDFSFISKFSISSLSAIFSLSQIYDFCFREIFAVEDESAVRHILSSEIAHLDCAPGTALSHLDDRRNVGFLVDGDNQFLYRTPLVLSNQVNLIVAASIFQAGIVTGLIYIDKCIRVH